MKRISPGLAAFGPDSGPKSHICKVCGEPIWGEGTNPETGEHYYSHVRDGSEKHLDGSKVEPEEGST